MINIMIMLINSFLMQDLELSPSSISYTGTSWRTGTPRWEELARGELETIGEDPARGDSALPHVCGLQDWSGTSRPKAIVSLDMLAAMTGQSEHNYQLKFEHNNRLPQMLDVKKIFLNEFYVIPHIIFSSNHSNKYLTFSEFQYFSYKLQFFCWGEILKTLLPLTCLLKCGSSFSKSILMFSQKTHKSWLNPSPILVWITNSKISN